MKNEVPNNLISLIPKHGQTLNTRKKTSTNLLLENRFFQVFIFPCTLNSWFNLDVNIMNSEPISIFKSKCFFFICPVQNNIFNIFDSQGLKLLNSWRLGFGHLNEHGPRHNFQECMNLVCSCTLQIDDTTHYKFSTAIIYLTLHHFDVMNSAKFICEYFQSMICQ